MIDRLADGNPKKAAALAALIFTAKGVPFVYYGEEIGMHNITAKSFEEIADIQGKTHYQLALAKGKNPEEALLEGNKNNRDKSRSPMQWNAGKLAGFSTEKSWIKVGPDYKHNNVEELKNNKKTIFYDYKALIALRNKEKVLQYGKYDRLEYKDNQILYTRSLKDETVTVIVNFGTPTKIKLPKGSTILLGDVELQSNGYIIYKN